MGLIGGVARTAVVAGTWTAVSNAVSRRQAGRWAAQGQAPADGPARAAAQQAHARWLAVPPPPGRYTRPMFQPAPRATAPAPAPAAPAPAPAPTPMAPPAGAGTEAMLRRLRQLGELKTQGLLSDAEFAAQKRAILGD
jgi:hypothetical protein